MACSQDWMYCTVLKIASEIHPKMLRSGTASKYDEYRYYPILANLVSLVSNLIYLYDNPENADRTSVLFPYMLKRLC
jgi:hypothetical protein